MIFYILPFFIILLISLYINKNRNKIKNEQNKDYKTYFLIYSIIAILIIIYIQLFFSDIFINFLKNYTVFAYKLRDFKEYFFPKFSKPTLKNIKMVGGTKKIIPQEFPRNLKNRDYIVNNDLPLSDSHLSSIFSN